MFFVYRLPLSKGLCTVRKENYENFYAEIG